MSEKLEKDEAEKETITVPDDLEAKIKDRLQKDRSMSWHRAIRLEVDPDAEEDDEDAKEDGDDGDGDKDLDDDDLSDIDE